MGATYYDGLSLAQTDSQGLVPEDAGYGGNAAFGISGSGGNRRSVTGGAYSGQVFLFSSGNQYTGLNQQVSLNHSRQLARRWSMFAGVSGGTTSSVLGLNRTPFTQDFIETPFVGGTDVFDTRQYQISGGAGLAYQKSAKTTFSMTGGGSSQRYTNRALISFEGFFASGEVSHALTRRSSIGAVYSYGTSYFRRGYGESTFHTWAGTFQRRLSKTWSTGGSVGMYRVESDRLTTQAIDPLIAALTGQTAGVVAQHAINYGRSISLGLGGNYRTSSVYFGYSGGLNPGNGIFLTSDAHTGSAQYNYLGFKRLGVSTQFDYVRYRPILSSFQGLQNFVSYGGSAGLAYRLISAVHMTFNASLRRTDVGAIRNFSRDRYFLAAGLAFSPGELPLLPW